MHRRKLVFGYALLAILTPASIAWASFAGTDVFLPSVGRGPGNAGSFWYTTAWVYNPNDSPVELQVYLLERGNANPSPRVFTDTIPAGDTRRYADAVYTLFKVEKNGALRFVSSSKVVVNGRIYSQPPGGQDRDTVGQFFAAIPASFAIGLQQKTQLLGMYQTSPIADSQYRYNFGFVETTGKDATVRVTVLDQTGASVTSKAYTIGGYGALQYQAKNELASVSTQNDRLQVEVVSGSGKVVAFGSCLANVSNDPSTFEMSFRDELLAENGSGGLTAVSHDATLSGDGTAGSPLGIANSGVTAAKVAPGQVVKSVNGLKDAVTLAAGSNVTITPSGQTLTIAATGGGGGSGVPSVNGITGAVTIAGAGSATVGTAGSTVTVTGAASLPPTGPAGGALAGTYPNPTLAASAVGTPQLADLAVAKGKLAAAGGSNGQLLGTDGTNLVWQTPSSGLTLPYQGHPTQGDVAFLIEPTSPFSRLTAIKGRATAASDWLYFCEVGVQGVANSGYGVIGNSESGTGVYGTSYGDYGVNGASNTSDGVHGISGGSGKAGVFGESDAPGGYGVSGDGVAAGVNGVSGNGPGVAGSSGNGPGVAGSSTHGDGLQGTASESLKSGVYAINANDAGYAGYFRGQVGITGNLSKGGGSFKIDHPLDPENKYLYHSFVESPDMKNIYDGVVVTDDAGLAVVELPAWFEALNRDFRYQLTVIGRFAQAIVERKVEGNRFSIRTNLGGVEVSWMVTGIRKDAYANLHRIPVEEDKPEAERGTYLHPDAFGQPSTRDVEWVRRPEMMRGLQEREAPVAPQTP